MSETKSKPEIEAFVRDPARATFRPMNLDGHRQKIRDIERRVQQLKVSL